MTVGQAVDEAFYELVKSQFEAAWNAMASGKSTAEVAAAFAASIKRIEDLRRQVKGDN